MWDTSSALVLRKTASPPEPSTIPGVADPRRSILNRRPFAEDGEYESCAEKNNHH